MNKTKYILKNKEDILNFKPTQEQIKNAQEVFFNMAKVEAIKPIVEAIQEKVLFNNQFKASREHQRLEKINVIQKLEHTYLMNDKDFNKYLFECYEEYIKAGLNAESDALYIKNKDSQKDLKYYSYCPLLIVQDDLRKAKQKLIVSFESVTGFKLDDVTHSLKIYHKYVELTLKLMVKYVNKEDVLKGGFKWIGIK